MEVVAAHTTTAETLAAITKTLGELVESGVALPVILQQWSRLQEIGDRLNESPHTTAP